MQICLPLLLLLLCLLCLPQTLAAQVTISHAPQSQISPVENRHKHGVFYVPKTQEAIDDFENNGNEYNAIRLHLIESALNNTSNLTDAMAFLDLAEAQLQDISNRSEKVIFIFEKMPAWLSSSSDGSPAQTPGWFVLNTKPPADYSAWNNVVSEITNQLVNDFGIDNVFFEIWNEPDLGSWTATEAEYFELFENTYDAIKSVDNGIPVGGPATNYWGNHINWQPPYGHLNTTLADSSLLGRLIDSSFAWNKPLDFVSWHNFTVAHQTHSNAENYITNKCASLGIPAPERIVSEWNTPSALRETAWQPSFFARNSLALDEVGINTSVVAAWQDFDYNAQEFHSDYGLISYGGIHKPAYKALQLYQMCDGEYLNTSSNIVNDDVYYTSTVKDDTVRTYIVRYVPDPFVAALNRTLFSNSLNVQDLDDAGLIDIANNSVSPLDSIYQGFLSYSQGSPHYAAVQDGFESYQRYDSLRVADITVTLNYTTVNPLVSFDHYIIDSLHNNSIDTYDSLINAGFNQTNAINEITQDQSLDYIHDANPNTSNITVTIAPNAVHLVQVKAPEFLSIKEEDLEHQVMIYPNPTNETIHIESEIAVISCAILDLKGRVVEEHLLEPGTEAIPVYRLQSGIYFLELNGPNVVKRFVKN